MLRGRCSCAISERTRPLPRTLFARAELRGAVPLSSCLAVNCKLSTVDCFSPLSLIIPVHPRNSPVSPIIPVHTQKQGGGTCFSALPCCSSSVTSVSSVANQISGAGDSNRLEQKLTASEGVPYTKCKPTSTKPPFSWTIIKIVGAPTYLNSARSSSLHASAFSAPLRYLFLLPFRCSPLATSHSPLSLSIPVHTQKQGGGACFLELSTGHPTKDVHPERAARAEGSLFRFPIQLSTFDFGLLLPPNSFVFSCRRYYILNYMNNNIVGAPTYCKCLATGARSLKSGPPQKHVPRTNCELLAVNGKQGSAKHAFYRGIIKNVGAPTFLTSLTTSRTNANHPGRGPLQLQGREKARGAYLSQPSGFLKSGGSLVPALPWAELMRSWPRSSALLRSASFRFAPVRIVPVKLASRQLA